MNEQQAGGPSQPKRITLGGLWRNIKAQDWSELQEAWREVKAHPVRTAAQLGLSTLIAIPLMRANVDKKNFYNDLHNVEKKVEQMVNRPPRPSLPAGVTSRAMPGSEQGKDSLSK